MRRSLLTASVAGTLLLRALPADACGGQPERGADCPTTYGSAGALFSFAFGARQSFGIGAEFSATHLPNNLSVAGVGGFLNGVYYFTGSRYFRFTAGGQASYVLGAEIGATFLSRSSGGSDFRRPRGRRSARSQRCRRPSFRSCSSPYEQRCRSRDPCTTRSTSD